MQNLEKSLRLLNIPVEAGVINGQINKRMERNLVEHRITDFTKMVRDSRGKRVPTVTSNFVIETTESLFGAYPLNLLSGHIHASNMDITFMSPDLITLHKPANSFVHNGKKHWIGWSSVNINKTSSGYDYVFLTEQGFNVTPTGEPIEYNPDIVRKTILRKEFSKTSTRDGVALNIFNKTYPSYTINQLKSLTGYSDYELASCFAWVWKIEPKTPETHCLNIATDVKVSDDFSFVSGEVFINGITSKEINFRSLTASYGKKLPGFVTRWKLYHSSVQKGVYGTAWDIKRAEFEDTKLNLIKADKISYDAETNTLTYIDDCTLVFDFEFLPAQGKNETWGTKIDLDTFQTNIFL